jgi:hypothetical protein
MKVAIILTGHCRDFDKTFESFENNVFKKYNTDVYFNTWDVNQNSVNRGVNSHFNLPNHPVDKESILTKLKPYLKNLPIDSSNYWHYKNYCGLLEWSIDNRNDKEYPLFQEYMNDEVDNYEDYLKIQSGGWGHPSAQMMEKWVKEEFIKNVWKNE